MDDSIMNRNEKILRHINKKGRGLEIGPSHNPVAPKREGYKVHIIDHMNREQLLEKYKNHHVDINKIEDVDFVWNGESYSSLTGKTNYYDYIIASHVIEHMPDLVGFIEDCSAVLKDDGILSIVVPDKRYCFDRYRPITGISRIIDSHLCKNKIHTAGTVAEYFLNVVSRGGHIAWDKNADGEYRFVHSLSDALLGIKSVVNENKYYDVHAWCFTPHSFRLIVDDLYSLGLISLREIDFFPTEGCEFYVTLGRHGTGHNIPRLEILETIEKEESSILRTEFIDDIHGAEAGAGTAVSDMVEMRQNIQAMQSSIIVLTEGLERLNTLVEERMAAPRNDAQFIGRIFSWFGKVRGRITGNA